MAQARREEGGYLGQRVALQSPLQQPRRQAEVLLRRDVIATRCEELVRRLIAEVWWKDDSTSALAGPTRRADAQVLRHVHPTSAHRRWYAAHIANLEAYGGACAERLFVGNPVAPKLVAHLVCECIRSLEARVGDVHEAIRLGQLESRACDLRELVHSKAALLVRSLVDNCVVALSCEDRAMLRRDEHAPSERVAVRHGARKTCSLFAREAADSAHICACYG